MLSDYILNDNLVPGSTIARLVSLGFSPVNVIFNTINSQHDSCINDGIVDSLRNMIFSEHFIKPWCHEYILVKLLTKAF